MKRKLVNINNLRCSYTEAGKGKPTLVLLHGWGGSSESWGNNIENLSLYYKYIVLDLPLQQSNSKSENPSIAWGIEEYHSYFKKFLRETCIIEPFVLIGKSFGGRIAIRYASENPKQLRGLILVSAAGIEKRGVKIAAVQSLAHIGKIILGDSFSSKLREKFNKALGINSNESKLRRETRQRVTNQDLSSLLPQIQAPTLIIWGEKDKVLPLCHAQEMVTKIPNSHLVIIPGADHFLHEKQAKTFNNIVKKFVHKLT